MALLQNVIMRGTHAARPAAGSQGLIYFESDTGQLFRDSGSAWQLVDLSSLFATKGDLLVGTGSGTVAKLAAGTDTYVLTADSAQTDGIKWAAASAGGQANLNSASSFMTSNLTLTTINTWYDGPSLSLAAGTWIVHATGHLLNNSSAYTISARIWDGTTVYGEAQVTDSTSFANQAVVMARIVLGSTTTIKVSFNSGHAGSTVYATLTNNGTTNKATQIIAFQAA